MHHLVVVHEFGNYTKGQRIETADEVAMVLASPQHTNVVKVPAPAKAADAFEKTTEVQVEDDSH